MENSVWIIGLLDYYSDCEYHENADDSASLVPGETGLWFLTGCLRGEYSLFVVVFSLLFFLEVESP
jgi:hypothetical protein